MHQPHGASAEERSGAAAGLRDPGSVISLAAPISNSVYQGGILALWADLMSQKRWPS